LKQLSEIYKLAIVFGDIEQHLKFKEAMKKCDILVKVGDEMKFCASPPASLSVASPPVALTVASPPTVPLSNFAELHQQRKLELDEPSIVDYPGI
jgi:hypothetical protein